MLTTRCQHGASMDAQSLLLKATGMIINGSCCCGSVRFHIEGAPSMMGTCHCSRCRKLGTSTMVFVRRDQFTLTQGEADIETVIADVSSQAVVQRYYVEVLFIEQQVFFKGPGGDE